MSLLSRLLVVMALATAAAACGSDSDTTSADTAATGGTEASTATSSGATTSSASGSESSEADEGSGDGPTVEPGTSVAAIRDKGKITIGVKYDVPLFGLKNPTTGDIEGFDIEIGKMITEAIFGDDSQVEFVEAVSKNREPFIQDGKVDLVISTYTINDARKEVVDFAGPYYVAGQDILVKADDDSIKGVDDLNGKKVCSVTGSTSLTNVQEQAPQADVSVVFDKYSLCVEALNDGRVQAVTTDNIILLGFVADSDGDLKIVDNPFTEEPYGIGLKKGDTELRDFVNDVLEQSYDDGSWKDAFDRTVGQSGQEAPTPPPVDRY
ncbi:MAG: glutamate ABC transporter substrate-binding protein [Acidimicrobiales bacterium]